MHHPVYAVAGDRVTFLLTGAETGGAYAVLDAFTPAGNGPPLHVHHREDEAFLVVEGQFEFTVAGEPVRLGPGGSLFARKDIPHRFRNVGSTPGWLIIVVTPSGLEEYFAAAGTRLQGRDDPPPAPTEEDIRRLVQLAPKYGLEIFPGP